MDLVEQWDHVLGLAALPDSPLIIAAAPDEEDLLMSAIGRACPGASVTLLGFERQCVGAPPRRVLADGSAISDAIAPGAVDLVVLDHVIDDVVLEAVARWEGIEGRGHRDERSPRARALRAYWRNGDLERAARSELAGLVAACARCLKPSGLMVLSHRVIAADLPCQPMDLYTDYLALARQWLLADVPGVHESPLDGFDPHWWMCLEPDL